MSNKISQQMQMWDQRALQTNATKYLKKSYYLCFSSYSKKLKRVKLFKFQKIEKGFPNSSVDKESTCSAQDPSMIPGSGRPPGEGIGNPLQYYWASLVAQLINNLPAMWEACPIPGLGRSPGEGKSYPLRYSDLENSVESQGVRHNWATFTFP